MPATLFAPACPTCGARIPGASVLHGVLHYPQHGACPTQRVQVLEPVAAELEIAVDEPTESAPAEQPAAPATLVPVETPAAPVAAPAKAASPVLVALPQRAQQLLAAIAQHPGIALGDASRLLRCSPAHLIDHLNVLDIRGLIERAAPSAPGPRLYRATEAGRAALSRPVSVSAPAGAQPETKKRRARGDTTYRDLIVAILAEGPATQQHLADRMRVPHQANINRAVRELLSEGRITRGDKTPRGYPFRLTPGTPQPKVTPPPPLPPPPPKLAHRHVAGAPAPIDTEALRAAADPNCLQGCNGRGYVIDFKSDARLPCVCTRRSEVAA